MSIQWERREQAWLVQWFKLKYKDVLIAASANGGKRKQVKGANGKYWSPEATNMKKEGVLAGMPDLQIFKACRGYHSLLIEMKDPGSSVREKGVVSDLQKVRIKKLNEDGYYAIACWGWLQGKEVIDWYLSES